LRIADCGLRIHFAICNPQSLQGVSGMGNAE
jgi:hypothetical protein